MVSTLKLQVFKKSLNLGLWLMQRLAYFKLLQICEEWPWGRSKLEFRRRRRSRVKRGFIKKKRGPVFFGRNRSKSASEVDQFPSFFWWRSALFRRLRTPSTWQWPWMEPGPGPKEEGWAKDPYRHLVQTHKLLFKIVIFPFNFRRWYQMASHETKISFWTTSHCERHLQNVRIFVFKL